MMRNDFLLKIIFIIHILFWIYLVFGSFISKDHARFILLWLIPGVYVLHMFRFHVLMTMEKKLIGPGTEDEDVVDSLRKQLPFMAPFLDLQAYLERNCFLSPLNGQGMVILGAIISSRILLA